VAIRKALRRVVRQVGHAPVLAKLGPRLAPPMDKLVHRVTGGRHTATQLIVPSLVLTTVGRKSGEPRRAPLATVVEPGGTFLVVASNFGKEHHPAWSGNLLMNSAATVSHRGVDVDVTAHLLDADEKAAVWPKLIATWPAFDTYTDRSGRDLRVFRLTPVQSA
jgi:deazaflavin-dependent oxidoreductase (nitroreductase family)